MAVTRCTNSFQGETPGRFEGSTGPREENEKFMPNNPGKGAFHCTRLKKAGKGANRTTGRKTDRESSEALLKKGNSGRLGAEERLKRVGRLPQHRMQIVGGNL